MPLCLDVCRVGKKNTLPTLVHCQDDFPGHDIDLAGFVFNLPGLVLTLTSNQDLAG